MYHVDGDFGKVRFAPPPLPHWAAQMMFSYTVAGWHCCNELYHVRRKAGRRGYLLLITLKGEGRMRLKGREYTLQAGSVAILPQHWEHSYRTAAGKLWEFYWIHPDGEAALRLLDEIVERSGVLADCGAELCAESMAELMRLAGEKDVGYQWALSACVGMLLHRTGMAMQQQGPEKKIDFAGQVATYIEQRYDQPLPLQEVAAAFYVSESNLIRRFRAEVGMTPHEYLLKYRIEQAKRLLLYTNLTTARIAQQIGFGSASHFVSSFRRICGVTPGVWREKPNEENLGD